MLTFETCSCACRPPVAHPTLSPQVEERKKQRTDKWESERLERMRQKEAAVAGGTGGGADA